MLVGYCFLSRPRNLYPANATPLPSTSQKTASSTKSCSGNQAEWVGGWVGGGGGQQEGRRARALQGHSPLPPHSGAMLPPLQPRLSPRARAVLASHLVVQRRSRACHADDAGRQQTHARCHGVGRLRHPCASDPPATRAGESRSGSRGAGAGGGRAVTTPARIGCGSDHARRVCAERPRPACSGSGGRADSSTVSRPRPHLWRTRWPTPAWGPGPRSTRLAARRTRCCPLPRSRRRRGRCAA